MSPALARASAIAFCALAVLVPPGAASGRAETYVGAITCAVLPGYTRRPLVSRLAVAANGARLSYSHPAFDWQAIPMPADHLETGSGSIAAGHVSLHGVAPGNGSWSYTARYEGTVENRVMRLRGDQLWRGQGLPDGTRRACTAELRPGG